MSTTPPTTWLTPAEMVKRTGVAIDTLRYYEKEGLIVDIARAESGHRRYDEDDVEWVDVLRCLRLTGMSIQQMKSFATLVQAGDHTQPERYAELLAHRERVTAMMNDLQDALVVIDRKTATYKKILKEKGQLQ